MLGSFIPVAVQNLLMATARPAATTGRNFVATTATVSGASAPVLAAYPAALALSLSNTAGVTTLDKTAGDLAAAGYPRNGAFALVLAASTPQTVDLTNTAAAAAAAAGDVGFAGLYEITFQNTGAGSVAVSPGASSPFAGPLAGTAPAFTVAAGSTARWVFPTGWPVTTAVRNLKFDPGAASATINVCLGGY